MQSLTGLKKNPFPRHRIEEMERDDGDEEEVGDLDAAPQAPQEPKLPLDFGDNVDGPMNAAVWRRAALLVYKAEQVSMFRAQTGPMLIDLSFRRRQHANSRTWMLNGPSVTLNTSEKKCGEPGKRQKRFKRSRGLSARRERNTSPISGGRVVSTPYVVH